MPVLREMSSNARVFLDKILPKSLHMSPPVNEDELKRQLKWALYCEQLVGALRETEKLDDFLKFWECDDTKLNSLQSACLRLLENYLHNQHMTDDNLLIVFKAASQVLDQESLTNACVSVRERHKLYLDSSRLVQAMPTISLTKTVILGQSLVVSLNSGTLDKRLESMTQTLAGMEALLNIIINLLDVEGATAKGLGKTCTDFLLDRMQEWLGFGKPNAGLVNSLLASSVELTREICLREPGFLELWLRVLAALASNLQLRYYEMDHAWVWPSEDEITTEKFCGIWFAYSQLTRHFSHLSSVRDKVAEHVESFLESKQTEPKCSLWLELYQSISSTNTA